MDNKMIIYNVVKQSVEFFKINWYICDSSFIKN